MDSNQKLYAVGDWNMSGFNGLTVFDKEDKAVDYFNMEDGAYRHRHSLYVWKGETNNGLLVWMEMSMPPKTMET